MTQKPISLALQEIKSASYQMTFFNCIMDSLAVFMVSVLVVTLISLEWFYAFIPLTFYAFMHTYRAITGMTYKKIEKLVPDLNEQLRTAADNVDKENEIVAAFHKDVLLALHKVRSSYFLNFGRLTRELLFMAVISFLIIGTSAYQVKFLSLADLAAKAKSIYKPLPVYELSPEELVFEENKTDDIYGNKSVAELGREELNLQINPVLSDVNIGKVKDPEKKEFRDVPPREISATTDTTYSETIPKGYQKIVKNYFKQISK